MRQALRIDCAKQASSASARIQAVGTAQFSLQMSLPARIGGCKTVHDRRSLQRELADSRRNGNQSCALAHQILAANER